MTRLEWYCHLRTGWEPMRASHAWTQALIYEGKALGDVYFLRPNGDPLTAVTKLTIAAYKQAAWQSLSESLPFSEFIVRRGRRNRGAHAIG